MCSGDVVTMECVEKLIKKDMLCPITGQKLKDSDIIPLFRVSHWILRAYTCIKYMETSYLFRHTVDREIFSFKFSHVLFSPPGKVSKVF